MKVILLTQYFPPETGAPQNRLFATAQAIRAKGAEVTVLTAMPHYPEMRIHAQYRGKWHVSEQMSGLRVHRAWLYVSKSKAITGRLANYFSFLFSSLWVGLWRLRRSDVLFVESPPLFLGISAMLLAWAKGARLVFNVSDLWPESAVQLGLVRNKTLIRMSTWLEERCYASASLITGQTMGIVANIKSRFPERSVVWIPNGVDFDAIEAAEVAPHSDTRSARGIPNDAFVICYAGILGHAQGLEVVLHAANELRAHRHIRFLLVGEGPEKEKLRDLGRSLQLTNVEFVDRMPRTELLALLKTADAVVVPLRRNDLFKGAIPSKLFEALALAKPLLLGVEGEAKHLFIDEGQAGIAFVPEDPHSIAEAALRLANDRAEARRMGENGLAYVRENFDRRVINERLWIALRSIARE